VRLTLYEIEMTTRKASIGAGMPEGIGEDIGSAAAWLAGRNYDGVGAALKSIRAGMSKAEMNTVDKGIMIFPDAHVAVCGPSIVDLLMGEKSCSKVHLLQPDSAILLFGIAGVAASQHGCVFQFDFSTGTKVLVSADSVVEHGELPGSGFDLFASCYRGEWGGSITSMPLDGVEVKDEIWREVAALAAKTYVPESKASRVAGAGAGLNDND